MCTSTNYGENPVLSSYQTHLWHRLGGAIAVSPLVKENNSVFPIHPTYPIFDPHMLNQPPPQPTLTLEFTRLNMR